MKQVFTPWCINCETTSKHVEKLAKHFKGLDNLVFARIDASANEHPKLQVSVIFGIMYWFSILDKSLAFHVIHDLGHWISIKEIQT